MTRYFSISTINEQIPYCNMLFALAEELSMKFDRVVNWHRRNNELVVVEFEGSADKDRDIRLFDNIVRASKNIEARTCKVSYMGTI